MIRLFFCPLVLSVSLFAGALNAQTVGAMRTGAGAPIMPKFEWKRDIVATVFWVGEQPTQNNPTPNVGSSWDPKWMTNFGGYDDPAPENRSPEFRPAGFVPRLNPFYVALPYNDVINHATTKDEASKVIPWFRQTFKRHGKSVCHNRWIAIRHEGRVCYAQWSDCGPFTTDDASYVFGNTAPVTTGNGGAGLDLAPAVRDFLDFTSGKRCDWRFVEESEVPDGPWKSYGTNNPFSKHWQKDGDLGPVTLYVSKGGSSGSSVQKSSGIIRGNKIVSSQSGLPGFTMRKVSK